MEMPQQLHIYFVNQILSSWLLITKYKLEC